MRWTERWRKRLRVLTRRDAVEGELDEELAFHLEMETQKNVRAGMAPAEARRRALLRFGGVEKAKEEVRDARAFGWVGGASLDFKLGMRMLARYPGLALVGGAALAFAIAVGAVVFEGVTQIMHPRIPLHEGHRLVGIRVWDAAQREREPRVAYDLAAWRRGLRTVHEVGAYHAAFRNLAVPGGSAEPVAVAEITASGFRAARVPPLLGRWLADEDERPGAAPVVVIGHEVWRTRFGGDPRVVGREARVGGVPHTVVGVMPEGFRFPIAQRAWVPLRLDPAARPGEGPALVVFGRLAPGATLGDARAELAARGRSAAAASPGTHRHLRPDVTPYAYTRLQAPLWTLAAGAYGTNAAALAFLLLVCANVATLVFARTAARESELVVRTALGASRRRIVLQLFAESLVLGAAAGAVGLGVAALGVRWGTAVLEAGVGELPFWFHPSLSPRTVLYTAGLAVAAAAVAGVVPALRMTGRGAEGRLRQAAAGGSSLRFGRLWTGIIVTQVAFTTFAAPLIVDTVLDTRDIAAAEPGVASSRFLTALLVPGGGGADALAELERRVEAEPGVGGATFAEQMPGAFHPRRAVEVEGVPAPATDEAGTRAQVVAVAPDFFGVLGVPLVAGRAFAPGGGAEVVVNEDFARTLAGGRSPVGLRLRYVPGGEAEPGSWHEIVGVVRQVGMTFDPDLPHAAGVYHPLAAGAPGELRMAVRLRGDPAGFAPRLRALATEVDPALQLHAVRPMESARQDELATYRFWVRVSLSGLAVVLLLSALGIYSVMAFTVSRRTREIGIRVALGANPRRIVRTLFARAFAQVGGGVALGLLVLVAGAGGIHSLRGLLLLSASAALMLAATLGACIVPSRRALAVQPTEAMRADT